MKIATLFLGLLILFQSVAIQPNAQEVATTESDKSSLPESVQTQIDAASVEFQEATWLAMSDLKTDSSTVPLLVLIKKLRNAGFGAVTSEATAAAQSDRSGSQNINVGP